MSTPRDEAEIDFERTAYGWAFRYDEPGWGRILVASAGFWDGWAIVLEYAVERQQRLS